MNHEPEKPGPIGLSGALIIGGYAILALLGLAAAVHLGVFPP